VSRIPGARTKNPIGRPVAAQTLAIRQAVLDLMETFEVMTVRQAFYALTVAGVVEKTEAGYRQVQRQILLMRRNGMLPWRFIADGTRWVRVPETWDAVDDALQETISTYRRNLWRSQNVRLEFWLEKDALASIVSDVTFKWGVRLMVSRGQSSETYCYRAAQDALAAWQQAGVETFVYTLYDYDRSGEIAAEKIREKLTTYSDGAPISVVPLAVLPSQIHEWNLPTRPAKENKDAIAVELDAIPPDKLTGLVHDAIVAHIDRDAWRMEQAAEESERHLLRRIIEGAT
jgi:hypothetical protein